MGQTDSRSCGMVCASSRPSAGKAEKRYREGLELLKNGKSYESLECFDAAIAIDPYLVTAHHHRGTALTQLGRIDEAVGACNKALELDPGCRDAMVALGVALHLQAQSEGKREKDEEAVKWLGMAVKSIEAHQMLEDPLVRLNYAIVLTVVGRKAEALAQYLAGSGIFLATPSSSAAATGATTNGVNGTPNGHQRNLSIVARVGGDITRFHVPCILGAARLLEDMDRKLDALKLYDDALDAAKKFNAEAAMVSTHNAGVAAGGQQIGYINVSDLLYNRGTLLFNLGRMEDADHDFAAIQLDQLVHTSKEAALNNHASVLLHLGREDEANPLIDDGLKLNPTYEPLLAKRKVKHA